MTTGHELTERELAETLDRTPEVVGEAMQAARCRSACLAGQPGARGRRESATVGALIPAGDDEYERAETAPRWTR